MFASRGSAVFHLPQPLPNEANQEAQGHTKENHHKERDLHLHVKTDQRAKSFWQELQVHSPTVGQGHDNQADRDKAQNHIPQIAHFTSRLDGLSKAYLF